MRKHLGLVMTAMAVIGCDAGQPASGPTASLRDNAYLQRIVSSTVYGRQAAALHGGDVSAEVRQEIEAVFGRDKERILQPLLRYIRTFDGGEYPELAVDVFGLPSRESDDEIVFHISVLATVSPRGTLRRGGMRPLLEDSYLGHVMWDHRAQVVRGHGMSGQQCHTVPQAVLERTIGLAAARNPVCSKERLQRGQVRWFPAWYTKKESSLADLDTGHSIVMLPFMMPGDDSKNTPVHVVFIDPVENQILRVERWTIDMGPRYERRLDPE